ncbi:MAG: hypothetical protein HFJ80_03545 [Clostridiales bacterium]|nr:hypothetical protein [Clostridiales bacterium]
MKKFAISMAIAAFTFIAVLPVQVFAAEKQRIELVPSGNQTEVILHLPQAAAEGTSSLQLSLKITANTAQTNVEFLPSSQLPAKVVESRYHRETETLNIYLAGTQPLFDEQSPALSLGRVTVDTAAADGVAAKVSVIEDSLKLVTGTELVVQKNGVEYPDAVELVVGNGGVGPTSPDEQPETPPTSDTTRLREILAIADGYAEEDYTPESYQLLKEAVEKARALLEKPEATQTELEEAQLQIENAIGMLVLKNDQATGQPAPDTSPDHSPSNGANTGDPTMVAVMVIVAAAAGIAVLVFSVKKHRTPARH